MQEGGNVHEEWLLQAYLQNSIQPFMSPFLNMFFIQLKNETWQNACVYEITCALGLVTEGGEGNKPKCEGEDNDAKMQFHPMQTQA